MTKLRTFALFATVAATAGGWYMFRPDRLWRDTIVAESLEQALPMTSTRAAAAVTLLHGHFRGVSHDATGTARVHLLDDGSRVLRFTDFATSNGPDLYVYLVAAADATDADTIERVGYISLGRLKGNRGDQNYVLPPDADLARYRSVSIWCKRFRVNFATAALSADTLEHDEHDEHVTMPATRTHGVM